MQSQTKMNRYNNSETKLKLKANSDQLRKNTKIKINMKTKMKINITTNKIQRQGQRHIQNYAHRIRWFLIQIKIKIQR